MLSEKLVFIYVYFKDCVLEIQLFMPYFKTRLYCGFQDTAASESCSPISKEPTRWCPNKLSIKLNRL